MFRLNKCDSFCKQSLKDGKEENTLYTQLVKDATDGNVDLVRNILNQMPNLSENSIHAYTRIAFSHTIKNGHFDLAHELSNRLRKILSVKKISKLQK